jgi:GntR family transcriptional regulator, transcriptional repressor for pyruvate dehydrogenase complex
VEPRRRARPAGPRAPKTAERVARDLVRDIVAEGLRPGDVLPSEAALLERYGVGRPTLREAVRILEVQELVWVKPGPGGGPVVGEISPAAFGRTASLFFRLGGVTFRELLAARLVLEPLCARVAARTQDPDGLARLQAAMAQGRAADLTDDDEYLASSTAFHSALTGASGNGVLDLVAEGVMSIYERRIPAGVAPVSQRQAIIAEHQRITDAIVAGDAPEAERLVAVHVEDITSMVERTLPDLLDTVLDWG